MTYMTRCMVMMLVVNIVCTLGTQVQIFYDKCNAVFFPCSIIIRNCLVDIEVVYS